MLSTVIDKALLLHGQISDELYVFALKQEFSNLKNIQKTRELYTSGLHVHKNSSALYLEAFKCELAYSKILTKKVLRSGKTYIFLYYYIFIIFNCILFIFYFRKRVKSR